MLISDDVQLQQAIKHLESILISGETIVAWAIQHRFFAIKNRRLIASATTGRFIIMERHLLGGFKIYDTRWQDLAEIKIDVGILGTDLLIRTFSTKDLSINNTAFSEKVFEGFVKEQAQSVYRFAQAQDQAWREKRRVRELEELRAKSGGINLNASSFGNQQDNILDAANIKLQQAKQMLDTKLITDSEYETIKARVLNTF